MIKWLLVLPLVSFAGGSPRPSSSHTRTVEIRGMAFHPAKLTVAAGDTVVWINRDIVPHTATSTGRLKWDTGQVAQGATGRYVALHAGKVRYACTFHPTMEGTLVVK